MFLQGCQQVLKAPHYPTLCLQRPLNGWHCMSFIVVVVNQMPKFVVELKGPRVSELNTLTILQCSAVDSVVIVK